jgi:NAD-dependent DNA ligase
VLASALGFNMPGYFFTHAALAAVYGQLGEHERARAALRELHALVPDFGALVRQEFGKWVNAEHTEHLLDGLRKAGLAVADEKELVP